MNKKRIKLIDDSTNRTMAQFVTIAEAITARTQILAALNIIDKRDLTGITIYDGHRIKVLTRNELDFILDHITPTFFMSRDMHVKSFCVTPDEYNEIYQNTPQIVITCT